MKVRRRHASCAGVKCAASAQPWIAAASCRPTHRSPAPLHWSARTGWPTPPTAPACPAAPPGCTRRCRPGCIWCPGQPWPGWWRWLPAPAGLHWPGRRRCRSQKSQRTRQPAALLPLPAAAAGLRRRRPPAPLLALQAGRAALSGCAPSMRSRASSPAARLREVSGPSPVIGAASSLGARAWSLGCCR